MGRGKAPSARLENSDRLQRALDVLLDGHPHTTRDIIIEADVCAVNSIVTELRGNGFIIECEAGSGIKAGEGMKAGSGIKAGEGIEAGEGIKAGEGIEAGEGIKAGEGIEAGSGIKAGWGFGAGEGLG